MRAHPPEVLVRLEQVDSPAYGWGLRACPSRHEAKRWNLRDLLFSSDWRRRRRFTRIYKHPERARAKVWSETAQLLQRSPFWLERLGGSIPPLESFSLTTFEDYREAIEDTQQAGISALNGEEVDYFAKSSGSLGGEKYFPWTSSSFRQILDGLDNIAPLRRLDGHDCTSSKLLGLEMASAKRQFLTATYAALLAR